ncbi:MAG: sugar ABC transporter ATP-binding protein [Rhizobiaceae bacterium]|nr:sugar ABC transporter ATP-binding protein [Rhizobiaceae bacterium]
MIRLSAISKSFPGVKALQDVSFEARAGEVHALLGENGSGKSTLTKIIGGLYQPDAGKIEYDGAVARWSRTRDASDAGIHVIYQEHVMFQDLTVAENVFISEQPLNRFGFVDYAQMERRAAEALKQLGTDIDVRRLVKTLSVAEQQMVEIAKALVGTIKVLILDEPTAVIAGREVELLFERIAMLRSRGVAVIYISHRLEEIFRIADRVTVLKDGRLVGTCPIAEVDREKLVSMMVGRKLSDYFPPKTPVRPDAPIVLEAKDVNVGSRVRNASFALRAGEIVGLSGMVGSGRTELAMAVFGGLPMSGGRVTIDGTAYERTAPMQSIRNGVGMLTEDRKAEGLMLNMNIAQNISAASLQEIASGLFLDSRRELDIAVREMDAFKVAAPGPMTKVLGLSGGNQQKVLFGRWVHACKKVLLLDEPTRGVDVGAKAEIYRLIRTLADQGLAILVISSELPEIIGLSNRVLVMRDGEIRGELLGDDIGEENIMALATHH